MRNEQKTAKPDLAPDSDIEIGRKLRAALGHPDDLGTCQDCGGLGLVPAMALSQQHGASLWKGCPTCGGHKAGGRA